MGLLVLSWFSCWFLPLLQRWVQEDKEELPGGQDQSESRTWTRAGVWDWFWFWVKTS